MLPRGFHRIRHYGLLANAPRVDNPARARQLLAAPLSPLIAVPVTTAEAGAEERLSDNPRRCPCCGAPMVIVERFEHGRAPPPVMQAAA